MKAASESATLFGSSPRFLPCLLLIAAVMAAYLNSLGNAFVFDDQLLVVDNEYLRSWTTLGPLLTGSTIAGVHITGGFYRPLQMLLYFLIYQATGPVPFGFHLLNVVLHAANACLLFTLGRKLNFNPAASFLAALIWAVHPIHTEAITYASGTADPLYAFFCLSGLLVLFPDFAPRRFFYAIPVMGLALLSKETAAMFPLLAMSCLFYLSRKRFDPKTYLPTLPLWIIAVVYSCWRATVPGLDGPQSFARFHGLPEYLYLDQLKADPLMRLSAFLSTLPAYLELLIWPHGLHIERDFNIFLAPPIWSIVAGATFCLASLAIIIRGEKQFKPLGWGLFWFFAAHAPDTGLVVLMNAMFLEHWMYLPTAGFFLGLAETISLYLQDVRVRKLAMALSLIPALAFATATVMQNLHWRDSVGFYNYLITFGGSSRVHNDLANAYASRGEYEEAIAEYHHALEDGDTYAEVHHNLGVALLKLPDQREHMQEAIGQFERAVEIDPNFYRSYGMLAQIYEFYGDKDKAAFYKTKEEAAAKNHSP